MTKLGRKWRELKFALYTTKHNVKVPILIIRQEGDTVYYRTVRSNGRIGAENSILADSPRLSPTKGSHFSLRVDGRISETEPKSEDWEVSIPDIDSEEWRTFRFPLTKTQALREAQKTFGADSLGRIYIVRPVEDEQPRERSNL